MNTKFLLCEIENKVAVVTISHAPGNKLNTQVYQEIAGLMGDLETNKNVHAIVITGLVMRHLSLGLTSMKW